MDNFKLKEDSLACEISEIKVAIVLKLPIYNGIHCEYSDLVHKLQIISK